MAMLNGHPLLQYTLDAAAGSTSLSRCVFTSDDPEMMDLARERGCEVLFRRPEHLASDTASSIEVVLHTLDWLKSNENYEPDAVVLLQPTCPFRTSADIDSAIDLFKKGLKESQLSVSPVSQHPCEMIEEKDGHLRWAVNPPSASGRQSFPEYFFITGAIFVTTTAFLRRTRMFFDGSSAMHIIDRTHGFDIDDPDQLEIAQALAMRKLT
jgi:CMP-N-acetylneuraminic acid synthetase